MFEWSGYKINNDINGHKVRVLDVGCGFGGTSRLLASRLRGAHVTGITLSPQQVIRGTQLAADKQLTNVDFKVMDALNMTFDDNTFDFVWACESGEHMPDKTKYIEEMTRVLKPGGKIVIATWCQRHAGDSPSENNALTKEEKEKLQFLYDEWSHPHFISIEDYVTIMTKTGKLEDIQSDNWVKQTLPSWRHSIWVGVWDPWIVMFKGPK